MRSSLYCGLVAVALATPVLAKLPTLSDEAKAKAAETAAKTAWTDKVGLYKLCLTMDRIAGNYHKTAASAVPPVATAPCADPGPFVAPETIAASTQSAPAPAAQAASAAATQLTPTKDKPIEASEAHSPPGMAVSPPSTKATAAETMGKSKQ